MLKKKTVEVTRTSRLGYNPALAEIGPQTQIQTADGKYEDAGTILGDAAMVATANVVIRSGGWLMQRTPQVARKYLAIWAADAFGYMHRQNPGYAESMLNNINQVLNMSREEMEQNKVRADQEVAIPFDIPIDFIVEVQTFIKDIRDRALPLLPAPVDVVVLVDESGEARRLADKQDDIQAHRSERRWTETSW